MVANAFQLYEAAFRRAVSGHPISTPCPDRAAAYSGRQALYRYRDSLMHTKEDLYVLFRTVAVGVHKDDCGTWQLTLRLRDRNPIGTTANLIATTLSSGDDSDNPKT